MSDTNGWVAPGWEEVGERFQANFDAGTEVGAAFSAYHGGEKVVDLWGGTADTATSQAWERDTMVLVYSTTKGVTAMCANRLAQDGLIDVEAPVAAYWPEFAQAGKKDVTVAQLLSHQGGLPWVDGTFTLDEALAWDPVIHALEHQEPVWPPGTDHGYHATTFGWLVGEVVRRVTGKTIGTYLRDDIAGPLGAEFFIGLPDSEQGRVAALVSFMQSLAAGRAIDAAGVGPGPDLGELATLAGTYLSPDGPLFKALFAPGGALADDTVWNTARLRAAEIPAANGVCTARGLACLYGACVSDVRGVDGESIRILDAEQLQRALVPRTLGPDRVLFGLDLQWGLGFMLNRGLIAAAGVGSARSFGHFGMGGSAGWADPDLELGLGYVMNRLDIGMTGDSRSFHLMKACVDIAHALA